MKLRPLMLDLCCGLKGASAAFRDRGWDVITLDIDPRFNPDIVADLATFTWQGEQPDFVWISPPCTEFARESMPWCRTGKQPDLTLVNAAKRIGGAAGCPWVLENVRGAVPYLGKPAQIVGPFYLWGSFPPLGVRLTMKKKESYSSTQAAERAAIPYALSEAVAIAIEGQRGLWAA